MSISDTSSNSATAPRVCAYAAVGVIVAGVLLAAAALKAWDWAQRPIPVRSMLVLGQIAVEWTLGLALLSGVAARAMRLVAIACFGVFAAVAGYEAMQGRASCSCFGAVHVNPWYTFGMDVVILGLLVVMRPARLAIRPAGAWLRLAILVAAIVGTVAPGAALLWRHDPGDVVLEPEKWPGSALPVLDHVDIGDALRRGRWVVLFYHHDCPDCRRALDRLAAAPRPTDVRLAAIEVPPYGVLSSAPRLRDAGFRFGQLLADRKWFLITPLLAAMEDGRVIGVQDDPQVGPAMPWK